MEIKNVTINYHFDENIIQDIIHESIKEFRKRYTSCNPSKNSNKRLRRKIIFILKNAITKTTEV